MNIAIASPSDLADIAALYAAKLPEPETKTA